jgi:hypothetical protein
MLVFFLGWLPLVYTASIRARQDACQYLQSTLPQSTVVRSDLRFNKLSTENWYVYMFETANMYSY